MCTVQNLVPSNTVPIACTTDRTTVQNTANNQPKNPSPLKSQRAVGGNLEDILCDLLSSCITYTLRPGNSAALGKQQLKHTSTRCRTTYFASRVRWPFASLSLQMASCREAKYEGAGKASSAGHVTALSNAQRNATYRMPWNTVVESFPYSSSFVRQSDRRRRIRRKRRNAGNVLDVFNAMAHVHVEVRLELSGMQSELSPRQFSLPLLSPVERQRYIFIVVRDTNKTTTIPTQTALLCCLIPQPPHSASGKMCSCACVHISKCASWYKKNTTSASCK